LGAQLIVQNRGFTIQLRHAFGVGIEGSAMTAVDVSMYKLRAVSVATINNSLNLLSNLITAPSLLVFPKLSRYDM
jgi:hypothetical protein